MNEVEAYLDGVERTVVDDLGLGTAADQAASRRRAVGPPTEQDFWTDEASGPGTPAAELGAGTRATGCS